jgi:hypothetical protein
MQTVLIKIITGIGHLKNKQRNMLLIQVRIVKVTVQTDLRFKNSITFIGIYLG